MHVVCGMTYQRDCGGAKTAVPLQRQTIKKDKKV
jgi:hypothetical protein